MGSRGFSAQGMIAMVVGGCLWAACASDDRSDGEGRCAPDRLVSGVGARGVALGFDPDPISQSGRTDLRVSAKDDVESLKRELGLSRLRGQGVLAGDRVDVRNGLTCSGRYGAYSEKQEFRFDRSDSRFAEGMAYAHGDAFQQMLAEAAISAPSTPLRLVAHCRLEENAFVVRIPLKNGEFRREACFGTSPRQAGISTAEDGGVIAHELQHLSTSDHYSMVYDLNRLPNDEAGALNEAISDVMALVYVQPKLASGLDAKVFSPWVMGSLFGARSSARGAHRCPPYDSRFPTCADLADGFSARDERVPYRYPDGLGWPFLNGVTIRNVARSFERWDRIHNASSLATGMLWDVYESLQQDRGLFIRLAHEAVRLLPHPTAVVYSPIRFTQMARALVEAAELMSLSAAQVEAVQRALERRGVYRVRQLQQGWARALQPSVEDGVDELRANERELGLDRFSLQVIDASRAERNGDLDAGETVQVWFDIENRDELTAAGLRVQVEILSGPVDFIGSPHNSGQLLGKDGKPVVELYYQKVNGLSFVRATHDIEQTWLPLGNSFLSTWGLGNRSPGSGLWLKVRKTAHSGERVFFRVSVLAANGSPEPEVLEYQLSVH